MLAFQAPADPTTRAHLMSRVMRQVAVPTRIDSFCCWPALGAVNLRGDPRFRLGRGDTTLRRVVFALWCTEDGYLPAAWVVRARCGTPRCVRPDHLELVRGAVSFGGRTAAAVRAVQAVAVA
jgi:hypothetical protein